MKKQVNSGRLGTCERLFRKMGWVGRKIFFLSLFFFFLSFVLFYFVCVFWEFLLLFCVFLSFVFLVHFFVCFSEFFILYNPYLKTQSGVTFYVHIILCSYCSLSLLWWKIVCLFKKNKWKKVYVLRFTVISFLMLSLFHFNDQSHTEKVRYVRGKNHNLRLLRTNKTGNNYILWENSRLYYGNYRSKIGKLLSFQNFLHWAGLSSSKEKNAWQWTYPKRFT